MPLWGSRAPTSKPVAEKTSIHWLQVVAACMCRCIAGMVGCRNRFSYEFDCFCLYRFPQGFGTRGRLWANRRLVTHICCQWRHCIVAILVDRYIGTLCRCRLRCLIDQSPDPCGMPPHLALRQKAGSLVWSFPGCSLNAVEQLAKGGDGEHPSWPMENDGGGHHAPTYQPAAEVTAI